MSQTNDYSKEDNVVQPVDKKGFYICDRCGSQMIEKLCKISCSNCGNRFDCSDLNIYFD
jgi:hypothetical protein